MAYAALADRTTGMPALSVWHCMRMPRRPVLQYQCHWVVTHCVCVVCREWQLQCARCAARQYFKLLRASDSVRL